MYLMHQRDDGHLFIESESHYQKCDMGATPTVGISTFALEWTFEGNCPYL